MSKNVDISQVDNLLNNPNAIIPTDKTHTLFKGIKCAFCDNILFRDVAMVDTDTETDLLYHKSCAEENSKRFASENRKFTAKEADQPIKKILWGTTNCIPVKCPAKCFDVVVYKNLETHLKKHCQRVFRNCRSSKFGCAYYDNLHAVDEHEKTSCEYRQCHEIAEMYEEKIRRLEARMEKLEENIPMIQSGAFVADVPGEERIYFEQAFPSPPRITVYVKDLVYPVKFEQINCKVEERTTTSFVAKLGGRGLLPNVKVAFAFIAHS